MNFEAVIDAILPFFMTERCRFAVAGAFALHAYGLSRATGDIDFIMDASCRDKVVEFLEGLGYDTLYQSEGYSNHVHAIASMGRLDFIYVQGKTAEKLFSAMDQELVIGKWRIPVPSAEHLIALKVFAMKNDPLRIFREMADIQYLMTLPEVDTAEVKKYFEKFDLLDKYYEIKRSLTQK